jgi:non-specific serine/threonine protein kinase
MPGATIDSLTTFGELLKYLRHRARMTQRELGIAVGYSEAQIARLEGGRRLPDLATVRAQMVPALHIENEVELAERLILLAEKARGKVPAEPSPAPTTTIAGTRHNNLPAQLTRFIGREHDIGEVTQLLTSNRLVTLVGAGGMGKTRLALQIASAAATVGDFADGVWLIELAPLADPSALVATISGEFKIADEPCCTPLELLVAFLEHKQLLLILDNCEHIVAAVADLAERLLIACPDLHILATSREALRLPGEVNWLVPPLSMPDPFNMPPFEEIGHYEAIQLFVEHAQSARPGFELTPETAPIITQICHRLDGIPLAIEMAAAQVAVMTPQEIATRLDDRFALLTTGRRTALPRHQTLRATLEWSYNLLDERERVLLARLSVFADGFTADTVQTICSDMTDVLALLLQLVAKSLVAMDSHALYPSPDGQSRYRLLDTIHQYAAEKLHESDEADVIYKRLAEYIISLAVVRANGGAGPPDSDLLNRLEAELGNVRGLMAWSRSKPENEVLGLQITTALSALWVSRGYLAEASAWLENALARKTPASAELRVEAINGLLRLQAFRGLNLTPWRQYAHEVVRLAANINDPIEHIEAFFWAGYTRMHRRDYSAAQTKFEAGLALAQEQQFSHGIVVCTNGLSWVHLKRGDLAGAEKLVRQCLATAQEGSRRSDASRGDASQFDVVSVINTLTAIDVHAALTVCETEVAGQRSQARREDLAITLQLYAELYMMEGLYQQAEIVMLECLSLWRELGVQWNVGNGVARTMLDLGTVAWLIGDAAAARSWFEQSLEQYRRTGDVERVARLHILLGYTHLAKGNLAGATTAIERGVTLYIEADQPAGLMMGLAAFGSLAVALGHSERAARIFGAAAAPRDTLLLWFINPASRVIYEHEIALARSRLGGKLFVAAWAEGERMTLDQAIEFARDATSLKPRDP